MAIASLKMEERMCSSRGAEGLDFVQLMLFCLLLYIILFDKGVFYTCLIFVEVLTTALFLAEGIWFLRPCSPAI